MWQLSFKAILDTVTSCHESLKPLAGAPNKLKDRLREITSLCSQKLIDIRPNRREPRATKRRPKSYQLLTKPRPSFKMVSPQPASFCLGRAIKGQKKAGERAHRPLKDSFGESSRLSSNLFKFSHYRRRRARSPRPAKAESRAVEGSGTTSPLRIKLSIPVPEPALPSCSLLSR